MIRVAIAGCQGRMGQALIEALQKDKQLVFTAGTVSPQSEDIGLEIAKGIKAVASLESVMSDFDVLIDFTTPLASLHHVQQCLAFNKKLIIGTTGISEQEKKQIQEASQQLAIVLAPNTSIGVNVMVNLLKQAAKAIGDEADIEIVEAHHRHKADAPSGTALQMARAITDTLERDLSKVATFDRRGQGPRQDKEIGFSTIRAGDIVGEHTVMFGLEGERIEITHRASNRQIFALGALRAAKWLAEQKNGLYSMQDVLGFQ